MIIKVRYIVILAFMCCAAGVPNAFAQLSIQVGAINSGKLPLVSAQVRATQNGLPLTITQTNLFIIEDNRYTRIKSISGPDGGGFQTVEWYSQLRDSSSGVKFIFSKDGQLATAAFKIPSLPFLAFFRFFGQETRITELKFGTIEAGKKSGKRIYVKSLGGQKPLRIDSISTGTRFFTAEWKGGWSVPTTLPGELISGPPADIDIIFLPEENIYYRDYVTVYYEGGATDRLIVSGNTLEIPEKTVLRLTAPNGGEMLTPCQEYTVRWTGNVKEFPTIIEYTKDNGTSWKEIARVTDTTYLWKVPDDASDGVRVRVRQEFQRSAEGILNGESSNAQALGFSRDGTLFLSAHANGKITEWNVQDFQKIRTLDLEPEDGSVSFAGIGYGKDNSTVVAAFTAGSGSNAISTLAVFKNGELIPSVKIPLPAAFPLKKMLTDAQSRFFALVPDFGREILLYDESGAFLKTVGAEAPITAASLSNDGSTAIVSLLNGIVEFYNLPDFSKRSLIDLSYLPIIQQAALSPDAEFLAIATQKPTGVSAVRESEVYIINIASNTIIRHLHNPKSGLGSDAKALTFNATGRTLILGYASNPKVSVWNFAKEDDTFPYDDYSDLSLNLMGDLSDVSFGPDGRFAIASGLSSANGNLIYRRFTYPEADAGDATFRIVPPVAALKAPVFENTYLGAKTTLSATAILCNTGEAPIIIESAQLKMGQHFSLAALFLKDTIQPGECLNIALIFAPRDTGITRDTIELATCSRIYRVGIEGRSLPRNISLIADNTNFGELCVGEATERDLAFLKNNDPVPLTINSITVSDQFSSAFSILTPIKDTILQPGETLPLRIRFKPIRLGEDKRQIIIHYADQEVITSQLTLVGTGTGADVQSVSAFPFIPEILNRKLVLKNNSPNTVTVTKATLDQPGQFTVITPLPFDIPANSEGTLEIAWNGAPTGDVLLKVETTPCGTEKTITLRPFKGLSTVSVPTIEADARATDVQIPIRFKNTDNTSYGGKRFFEAELMVNPRMFLAESVTSEFGEAKFTQEISNGKRIIKVRVEGDFTTEGIAAVLHGVAGLAETLESPIEFNETSTFWGTAVSVQTQPGVLKITGAGSRRVIQPMATVQIMAVFPNPARDNVSLEIESTENTAATLEIYNSLGKIMMEIPADLVKGSSGIPINVAQFPAGTYRVIIKASGTINSTSLLNIAR